MASEKTELRQSYLENFQILDAASAELEARMQKYVNDKLGAIENGAY